MLVRPKLNFRAYTDRSLCSYLSGIHTALSTHAAIFVNPPLSLSEIETAVDNYQAAIEAWGFRGNHGSDQDYQSVLDNRVNVRQVIRAIAGFVTGVANGSIATVILAGMTPTVTSRPRLGPLPAPQYLRSAINAGTLDGRFRLRWRPVKGSKCYKLYSSNDSDPAYKTLVLETTKTVAVAMLPALEGRLQYFWVAAVGTAGESPISDVCRAYSHAV